MQKYKAIEIIEEKADKAVLFNDLQKISKNKKRMDILLSYFFLGLTPFFMLIIYLNIYFIHNKIIENILPYIILPLYFFPVLGFLLAEKNVVIEGDKKITKRLSKYYYLNNRMNYFTREYLSLDTYKYLSTIIEKEELKKIALLKLTYEDVGLKNYIIINNTDVKYLQKKLVKTLKVPKDKEIVLQSGKEEIRKEKKKKAADFFISSLYKK